MIGHPAIFLDRDGTIIIERGYLSDPSGVALETGALAGLRTLATRGWMLVVVSNQSGIARGYFSTQAAEAVNARTADLLREGQVEISGWYVCPHGPEDACDCRKPLPGLALLAVRDLSIDPARSWVIGDKPSDIGLAQAIGARSILVTSGEGATHADWARREGVAICADLRECSALIGMPQPGTSAASLVAGR
jgi:histidinol-phosphate phosphatase family protein